MTLKYKKTIITANFDKELNLISERIEKLNLPQGFYEFIVYTISELLANVKEHAKTNKASLVLIINKKKCSIRIADTGLARAVMEKNRINFQKNPKKILGVSLNIESSIKRLDFYKIIK